MTPEDSLRDEILRDVSVTTDLALTDVLPFAHATAAAVETYKAGSSELDEAAFWHKSLVRSFLAHVEVQCAIIRTSIAANASRLRAPIPANKLQEIASVGRRRSTEESVTLAFRHLPILFSLNIPFARGDENYRGFKALTDARESFTHPKKERDVCPFELFASTRPAMEWFFRHWMSILLRCSHSVYRSSLDLAQLAIPQLFKDAMLAEYRERQKELTTEVADSPALHAVRTVILPLLADTSRAMQLVKSATRATPAIGTQAALRCLIRTIFCEIEGTTNAAESLLRTRRSKFLRAGIEPRARLVEAEPRAKRANVLERGSVDVIDTTPPLVKENVLSVTSRLRICTR